MIVGGVGGIPTAAKLTECLKALLSIVRDGDVQGDRSICIRLVQLLNAREPIEVSPGGRLIVARFRHLSNVYESIEAKDVHDDKSRCVMPSHSLNAAIPIEVRLEGRLAKARFVHEINA
jgi:hypothetical protein